MPSRTTARNNKNSSEEALEGAGVANETLEDTRSTAANAFYPSNGGVILLALFCVMMPFLTAVCSSENPRTRLIGTGKASYYHPSLEGSATAGGENYESTRLTAAHRTLPIGSQVRVTNLENNKSVVVRINDRGPTPKDRIIDLSYAAAQKIDLVESGMARVRLELLES